MADAVTVAATLCTGLFALAWLMPVAAETMFSSPSPAPEWSAHAILLAAVLLPTAMLLKPSSLKVVLETAPEDCATSRAPAKISARTRRAANPPPAGWWRSCCGAGEVVDTADSEQFEAGLAKEETHSKYCGLREGPEHGELPSFARFAPEPLAGFEPPDWDELFEWHSDAERRQCDELREAVRHLEGPKDTMTILRVLRARQGNIEKAAAMYENMRAWHDKNGIEKGFREGVLDDSIHRAFDSCWKTTGFLGRDREGSPVYWDRIGTSDAATLAKVDVDFMTRHEVYAMTRSKQALEELSRKDGRPHMYFTAVVDVKGVGVQHMSRAILHMYQKCVRIDEDYYPEMVKRCIVVRAPWIFDKIWMIVKHFFDEGTRDKIQIAGRQNPVDALAPFIDKKWVPKALGGELAVGDDDYCDSLIVGGQPVSESLLQHIGTGRWQS